MLSMVLHAINKMACPYDYVHPPEVGDLFRIYEVSENAIAQF